MKIRRTQNSKKFEPYDIVITIECERDEMVIREVKDDMVKNCDSTISDNFIRSIRDQLKA